MSEPGQKFMYLLNAVERAAQAVAPSKEDYAGKRLALVTHVQKLEVRVEELERTMRLVRELCEWRVPQVNRGIQNAE